MSMDRDPNVYDREPRVYDRDTPRSSNTLAYLIGGLVIALGLLAFLFYDGSGGRDVSTTGSTTTTQGSGAMPSSGASTTPGTPASPGAPSRPATPAQ
jgi:hypothetical protein